MLPPFLKSYNESADDLRVLLTIPRVSRRPWNERSRRRFEHEMQRQLRAKYRTKLDSVRSTEGARLSRRIDRRKESASAREQREALKEAVLVFNALPIES